MQPFIFRSIILDKTPCLFTKKTTQSERWIFLFIAEEFEGASVSYRLPETLATDSEGERIRLPEENVAKVSSKYNDYQVKFI